MEEAVISAKDHTSQFTALLIQAAEEEEEEKENYAEDLLL